MKRVFLFLFVLLLVSGMGVGVNVLASGKTTEFDQIRINNNVKVVQFNDGRLAPVTRAELLSFSELNQVLSLIGFDKNEISDMPNEMKIEIVKEGGKKIETTNEGATYTYKDSDGNETFKIEAGSLEELKKIETRYKNDTSFNKSALLSGSPSDTQNGWDIEDGKWKGETYILYYGETSNGLENRYRLWNRFKWEEAPIFKHSDYFALAWGSGKDVTKLANSDREQITFYYHEYSDLKFDSISPSSDLDLEGQVWDFSWQLLPHPDTYYAEPALYGNGGLN